jgi:hypothetical protein
MYGGDEIKLHQFLTSVMDGTGLSASCPSSFTPWEGNGTRLLSPELFLIQESERKFLPGVKPLSSNP